MKCVKHTTYTADCVQCRRERQQLHGDSDSNDALNTIATVAAGEALGSVLSDIASSIGSDFTGGGGDFGGGGASGSW